MGDARGENGEERERRFRKVSQQSIRINFDPLSTAQSFPSYI